MAFVTGAGRPGLARKNVKQSPAACSSMRSSFAGVSVAVPAAPVVNTVTTPPLPIMPDIQAMRHRKRVAKLNRPADQRKALMRTLTTEIIRHGRVTTTLERCKAVRQHVDHMITLCKEGSLHSRRQALGYVYDKQLVHALFEQGAERYRERNGGYTRVVRTMNRKGDNARMGIIELV